MTSPPPSPEQLSETLLALLVERRHANLRPAVPGTTPRRMVDYAINDWKSRRVQRWGTPYKGDTPA